MSLDKPRQQTSGVVDMSQPSLNPALRRRPSPPASLGSLPLRRSANDVRAGPASPEVITSMLASFPSISVAPDHDRPLGSLRPTVPPPMVADSPRQLSPFYHAERSQRHQSPAPTSLTSAESVIDFKSPSTEEHNAEPPIADAAEPPVIRTSRPPSGMSRHTSKRPTLRQRTSSSGLRTAFSPKTPGTPQPRDVLSPLRSPSRDPGWQHGKAYSARPSMEKLKEDQVANGTAMRPSSVSFNATGRTRSKSPGTAAASPQATHTGRHAHRFLPHSTPGSSSHSPSRSNALNSTPNASNPSPSAISPQFILQGVRIPAIKAAEDELPPMIGGTFVPDRRSSLRYVDEQASRGKRRSRFSRRRKDPVEMTRSSAQATDVIGASQRASSTVQAVEVLDDDNEVTRRIKQLKAAKELREKSQSDRELSSALAATLPNFDPSLPSPLTSPPTAPGGIEPSTPTPRAGKRISDTGASRRLRINVEGDGKKSKRESFLLSPSTPDASNVSLPIQEDEQPPLPPPNPAFQSAVETRPRSHDQNLPRPSSRSKRWSTPEGDTILHKRELSGKQQLNSIGKPRQAAIQEDRPSTDRVEESVRTFLDSPRLSQRISSSDSRRKISFSEVGDPHGYTVICCVGMGLTRYITAFYEELARTLKLRLITLDRPGVGDSGAYTDSTYGPLQWPDDLQILCTHLSISSFSLLAHSAGAIYALATALKMPSHVHGKIHLLAPWIPPSQMVIDGSQSSTSSPASGLPRSQRFLRLVPTPFLKLTNSAFMGGLNRGSPKSSKSSRKSGEVSSSVFNSKLNSGRPSISQRQQPGVMSSPAIGAAPARPSTPHLEDMVDVPSDHSIGAAVLDAGGSLTPNRPNGSSASMTDEEKMAERRAYDAALTPAVWTLATKNSNPAVDLVVCLERNQRIGFRYADVDERVVIHHGTKDNRVPLENVRWLRNTMRNVELRVVEGEGHGLMANATVMGQVLEEISKEMEEEYQAERRERGRVAPTVHMPEDPFIRKAKSQPQTRRPTMLARDSGRI
ncbi:MAG: hypothetical protein M1828_002731 [Chrysothrix sp. TS-e1954]|nr:MAG: hypothetical protein M1828_002731 [Chrysothrix sp. TS-e1954]